ncbi:MAG: type II toxin-antitoxin system mRNA interferase toxin, RelE/StbE family [Candidatus Aenigmarchaeota archaeon]|nr:type II toxin-antitoxin system mRNA interferase toxin, RelE/StbE family [Candidatus Aenigmarchaeota archaeon]
MYTLTNRLNVDEIFRKLSRKNPKQLEIISKKVEDILHDPYRFKPLSGIMKGFRRAHIDKSYVLTYSIDEENKTVILEDYEHHDKIYRKR